MKVSDPVLLGPEFSMNGKGEIRVRNLLLHNAGFPPDPKPNYCKSLNNFNAVVYSIISFVGILHFYWLFKSVLFS